jgi:hypothetical protein
MAIFLFVNDEFAKQSYFRLLLLTTVASLLMDGAWLGMRGRGGKDDQDANGLEGSVMLFSLWMAYISLILKVVMIAVFWRTSLDFADIREQRNLLL